MEVMCACHLSLSRGVWCHCHLSPVMFALIIWLRWSAWSLLCKVTTIPSSEEESAASFPEGRDGEALVGGR